MTSQDMAPRGWPSRGQHKTSMKPLRLLQATLLIATLITGIQAQDIKGGGASSSLSSSSALNTKGGSSLGSSFRENIQQVQRLQQQQQVAPVQQVAQREQVSEFREQVTSQQRPIVQSAVQSSSFESQQSSVGADAEPSIYGSVKGAPGVDFPAYTSIPNTQFSCDGAPFNPGMYADESTGCQVYHLCYQGRRESFLCGIGTVFNQAIMSCDFWHSVECSKSSQYYGLNSELGKSSSEPGALNSGLQQRREFSSTQNIVQAPLFRPQQASNKFESSISRVQQQVVLAQPQPRPQQQSFSRVESSFSRSQAGGKVSPPKQTIQVVQSLSSFNEQNNAAAALQSSGKTSARKLDVASFSSQRTGGLLSPSRRIASYNSEQRNQFALESSPMKTVVEDAGQKVGSSLAVSDESSSSSSSSVRGGKVGRGGGIKAAVLPWKTANSIDETSRKQGQSSDEIWKPVFRSKTSNGKTTKNEQPREQQSNQPSTTTTTTEQPTSTNGPANEQTGPPPPPSPDQEPNFSGNSSPTPTTTTTTTTTTTVPIESSAPTSEESSSEVPSVPRGSPPPDTTTTEAVTSTAATDSPASIESDVGAAVSSTAGPDSPASESPSSETPSGPEETQPPPTTSTSAAPTTSVSSEIPPTTTTESADQPTTTTTSPASEPTSEEPATSEQPASTSEQDPQETGNKKKRKAKKKKRRTGGNQVEVANQITALRANASSVEYVG